MYGNQTDLADFYRGRLTLRQILARIQCLPPDAPIQVLLELEREQAAERRTLNEMNTALAPFA